MQYNIRRELKDNLGECDFDMGYFDGKHSTKRWLIQDEDIEYMYSKFRSGEVHLWIEALDDVEDPPPKKKDADEASGSRREDKEAKVEKAFETLQAKHKEKFSIHQLTLWARMIVNKLHDSYDDPPPRNPLIDGNVPKQKKDTLAEAIVGAATAIAKAVAPTAPKTSPHAPDQVYFLGRSADIRLKNLEQLKCLQQLLDDKVLTENEFKEQKTIILEALRKL